MNDYFAMARRHWWLVMLALFAGLAVGAAYNRRLPREFVSSASILVLPTGQDTNVAGGRTRDEINLDTEAQLVRSTAVAERAAAILKRTDVGSLAAAVSVEVPANTSVLQVKFSAPTAAMARAGAQAFAQSYLDNREASAKTGLARQIEAYKAKLVELAAELNNVNSQLARLRSGTPTHATLDSQRETTVTQINQLTNRVNQLSTETVAVGGFVREAQLPDRPVKPNKLVNVAAGTLLGLLVGVGLGGLREKLNRRIRCSGDVTHCGIPVLGQVPGKVTPGDSVFGPFSPGGRAFNRLRNEVVAALAPGDQVLVVTTANRGPAASVVAANLAAALARTGTNVVLLGANAADSLAKLFGVAPTPGLSDVLTGNARLSQAAHRAARNPTLRVIPCGGAGSAGGLLQSHVLQDLVAKLRACASYIVIEAPPTCAGADAQSLASLANAAIVAVEVKRARRPDLTDASEQLRRVGTPLLGAVLLPRTEQRAASRQPQISAELVPISSGTALVKPPVQGAGLHDDTDSMDPVTSPALPALDEACHE